MKKLLAITMFVALTCTVVYAADQVKYEAKNGAVTFDHKAHADKLGCEACHQGEPAKIAIDKKAAHGEACKDCHSAQSGPTKCGGCHVK